MIPAMAASRILVGHDGSCRARDALALGRLLADVTGARLVLARVVPWGPLPFQAVPVPELTNRYEDENRIALRELQLAANRPGETAETGPGESPAQGLTLLARELKPDVLVVGSSHRGRVGQVLGGSVAVRLLNGLDLPVAVAPAGYADGGGGLHVVGVGFDGTPEARAALQTAGELAGAASAEVRVIGVVESQPEVVPHPWTFASDATAGRPHVEERLRRSLESAAGSLPPGVGRSAELFTGSPVAVLADEAQTLDLLVVGSRGYGPVRRVLLGSVSGGLMRAAPCPVLVVPRPAPSSSDEPQTSRAKSVAKA